MDLCAIARQGRLGYIAPVAAGLARSGVAATGAMIEVKVGGLVVDKKSHSPVLLLRVPNTQRYLPIWIGIPEANAIDMALRNRPFERPLTHDLLKLLVDGLGGTVSRVVVTSLQDNTFFAKIFLTRENEIISIDARPSDSVALALRARAPIYLSTELLENEAVTLLPLEQQATTEKDEIDGMLKSLQASLSDEPQGAADGPSPPWPASDPEHPEDDPGDADDPPKGETAD